MTSKADHLDTWCKVDFIVRRLIEWDVVDEMHAVMARPDAHGRLCTGLLGFHWEDDLIAKCRERGLSCRNLSKKKMPYDLEVNGLRVQCKMSSQEQVVDIRPARPLVNDKNAERAYSVGDYDILAVLNTCTGQQYFVPAKELIDPGKPDYMAKWFRWDDHAEAVGDWTVFETARPAMFYAKREPEQAAFW